MGISCWCVTVGLIFSWAYTVTKLKAGICTDTTFCNGWPQAQLQEFCRTLVVVLCIVVVCLQVSLKNMKLILLKKSHHMIFSRTPLFLFIPTKLYYTSEYTQGSLYFEYFYAKIPRAMCMLKYIVLTWRKSWKNRGALSVVFLWCSFWFKKLINTFVVCTSNMSLS